MPLETLECGLYWAFFGAEKNKEMNVAGLRLSVIILLNSDRSANLEAVYSAIDGVPDIEK